MKLYKQSAGHLFWVNSRKQTQINRAHSENRGEGEGFKPNSTELLMPNEWDGTKEKTKMAK